MNNINFEFSVIFTEIQQDNDWPAAETVPRMKRCLKPSKGRARSLSR